MKTDKLQTMKQKAGKKGFKVPNVSCSLFQSFFSILLVILLLPSLSEDEQYECLLYIAGDGKLVLTASQTKDVLQKARSCR